MPHPSGWQTVPLADASKSESGVEPQGTSQSDGVRVGATPAESSPGPAFGERTVNPAAETGLRKNDQAVFIVLNSDPCELLPRWLKEMQQKPNETSLSGNELVLQNQKNAERGLESITASRSTTLVADSTGEIAKSNAPEADTNRKPVVTQIDTPEANFGETFESVERGVAAPAAVSPTPAIAVPATSETAGSGKEGIPKDVGVTKAPELAEPLPAEPKETNLASGGKPDEALASGSAGRAQPPASEIDGSDQQPAETSAKLLASVESNTVKQAPVEEWRKPRGYITIEGAPETPRNPGVVDHSPKPQDNRTRGKDRTLKVQERPATAKDYPAKVEEHPVKVPDHPSKPDEKSGDLRRFASAFLETDQTGNIADQHRFYADSVHFYREGDLSWTGVAAATRRYHQERQNKRYGTEGTAAVKGPVNGGFYVVEQPVTWSRAEGSRLTRGRSVLRLQVVPTNRGDWKITSIEEIGR